MGSDGMRVLIVEDEPLLAMLIEEGVRDLGHDVAGSAATVAQALAALEAETVDMALLDFTLGDDTNSLPVARRLQERGIPFAYLTGHNSLPTGDGVPVAPILMKPFTMDQLEQAMLGMRRAA